MSFLAKADELLAGRYRLLRPIGEGGMGGVWEATDQVLGCPIALKLVPEKHLSGNREQQVQRFLREARLAAQVQHPAVVRVTDFGVHEDTPYIAMELLEGESLADRMYRLPFLEIDEAVQICIGVLRGLCAAHQAGIVHRDIKPENVQLVSTIEGLYPKLIDFGISLGTDRNNNRVSAVTTNGHVFGTPLYMSPEHARGADIDGRADLYSLGIMLFEMLARQAPFNAETPADMMAAIVRDLPTPPCELRPTISKELSDVVMKALSKDPDDRYAKANEMAQALAAAAPGARPDTTGPVTTATSGVHRIASEAPTLPPPPPQAKSRMGISLLLSIVALCVGAWLLVKMQTDADPAVDEQVEQTSAASDTAAEIVVPSQPSVPDPENAVAPQVLAPETAPTPMDDPNQPIVEQVQPRRVRPQATMRAGMPPDPSRAEPSSIEPSTVEPSTVEPSATTDNVSMMTDFRQLDY
ncbi:MAG: protein kinase [Polyangiales bacterium]